jgi:predicted permease
MLRNYFKLALRNLTRQKAFSFINIGGLAVGLASSLVILLWVQDEVSYDRFHSKANQTYRLTGTASDLDVSISPAPIAPAMESFSEVAHTVRLWNVNSVMLKAGDQKFEERDAFYTESSFFDVFDFKLLYGDPAVALRDPNSIILTEALAMKYFGTADAVGMTLRKEDQDDLTVTGILAEPSGNSHLAFNVLLPWSYIATRERNIRDNLWDNFEYYSYVVLQDNTSLATFTTKVNQLFKDHVKHLEVQFTLQPVTDIHLHSHMMGDLAGQGNAQYVTVLAAIAVFIVLIACINFMNLSTARSARRAKEVGLRKVAGAVRWQLIRQFLGESLLVSALALLLAIIIVFVSLPKVNDLTAKALSINLLDPFALVVLLGITTVTGLLAGIYPALVLSGFMPIKVLKKDLKSGAGGVVFRNVLVIAQFVISVVLLVGTAVVYQQLRFIRDKNLGFDKENLLYMTIHGNAFEKITRWQSALKANPLTENVSIASGLPTNLLSGAVGISWQGKDPDKQIIFAQLFIDDGFLPVYEIELATGRNFNPGLRGDSSNYIINETAAATMGFTAESAIGQNLSHFGRDGQIVGVVKDFNFKPLQHDIEPLVMSSNDWGGYVVVRAEASKTRETIAALENVWNSLEDVYPFRYQFVDENLAKLYRSEQQVGALFTLFALLAIFISCLGLYGLSAYMAEQRSREIGIRKALGASVGHIVYLLNTRFIVPVFGAIIIAAPLAYFAMSQWLESFAFKIDFQWGLVLLAGILALIISVLTVTYESLKAAISNPLKSLREE